jgi:hypothetical protein
MTTIPGMTCEVEIPAPNTSNVPPRSERRLLTSACGGALGTILALAVLACLFVFFDGDRLDVDGSLAAARAAPRLTHSAARREKRVAAESPDVLRTIAAVRGPAPTRVVHPHRSHHIARSVARKLGLPAADLEVTNALARAELASSLP